MKKCGYIIQDQENIKQNYVVTVGMEHPLKLMIPRLILLIVRGSRSESLMIRAESGLKYGKNKHPKSHEG